jgi:hypothetical protein
VPKTYLLPLVFAAMLVPRGALAAACCTSATSFGVGRLLVWEDFAMGLQLSHARSLGQWSAAGTLRWNPAGFSDGLTQALPWTIVRLHERVQAQAWAPIVLNDRWSDGTSQFAGGFGDLGAAVRFEVLSLGQYVGLPSFAVTAGVLAPTGKRVEDTSPPLFAGTTGRGTWGTSLAVELEFAFLPWFVRLDAGAWRFFPFQRSDTTQKQQYGFLYVANLSMGAEVVADRVVLAVALRGEWEMPIRIEGISVPDSDAHIYSIVGSLSWRVDPHWTLIGAATNSIWPEGGGANRDARIGATLGLRYGHF